jgi:hypothetical protein
MSKGEFHSVTLRMKDLWTRIREWMQRDTNLTVQIWSPRKGVIPEAELKDVSIQGKVYSEDDQPTRKVMKNAQSFTLTVNPSFVRALCPFQVKRVTEQLVKSDSGKYLIVIEGIDPHSLEFQSTVQS